MLIVCEKSHLGSPSKSSGRQLGILNWPTPTKGRTISLKVHAPCPQGARTFATRCELLPTVRRPQNSSKNMSSSWNLKKWNLGRPWLGFWWLVDPIWTSVFDQFSRPPKSLELQQVQCEHLFWTIPRLLSWHYKSIKTCFVEPPSWTQPFSSYVD